MSSLLIIVTCLSSSKTVLQYNDGKVCWLPPDLSLNDKPAYKQSKCKADRRKECKETNIEQLLISKSLHAMNMILIPNMLVNKITVKHVTGMDMTFLHLS